MNKLTRTIPLFVLAAALLAAGIAATPAALTKPERPSVAATENGGEIEISWASIQGAQFYTIGWINWTKGQPVETAGGDWLSLFHYTTVVGSQTSYTVQGLDEGDNYFAIIRATDLADGSERFGGSYSDWSDWSATAAQPAGQHGDGFCPITGLPLGDGYLGVGDSVASSFDDQSFIMTSHSAPETINLSYADDPNQDFSPRSGRRFVQVCGVYEHDFNHESTLYEAVSSIMVSDAGIGFWQDNTYEDVAAETPSLGCEVWDIPADAQTAIYVVGLGGYGSGVTGTYADGVGLYSIELSATATP